MHFEDLPRSNKLPCAQRPIKSADFEKYFMSYGQAGSVGEFFQAPKFDGEKYLPRAENKLSRLGCILC